MSLKLIKICLGAVDNDLKEPSLHAHFLDKLALFNCYFLGETRAKSTNSCDHEKAKNMRNLKRTLLFSLAASKPELSAFKH